MIQQTVYVCLDYESSFFFSLKNILKIELRFAAS